MSERGIKSKPTYRTLEPVFSADLHLLAGEGVGASVLAGLWGSLQDRSTGSIAIHYTSGSGPYCFHDLPKDASEQVRVHDNVNSLCTVLKEALERSGMSVRLYLAGSEPFIWELVVSARNVGISDSAIQMQRCGSLARPVKCVHCKTKTRWVEQTIYRCPGCGLQLMVRDHFSPRQGIYQGVCVDAEVPGLVPPAEEFQP